MPKTLGATGLYAESKKKTKINEFIYKTKKWLTDIENKVMVTKGERVMGEGIN